MPPGGVTALIAATYVRVSTDEQAEHGYSLGHQREQCRERALALGAADVQEYADEGVSGAVLDRPGLSALRAAVKAGAIGLVVVYDPDRLARKLAYQLLVTDEIEAAGARLDFVNFEWRNTPEGQLFYALRGAVAQYEKEKIRERTMAGRRQKAKAGKMPSGFAAYGYTYEPERQTLILNPTEAPVVQRIFHLLISEGMGINGIANRLTEDGIPTRRGAPAWHRVVVRQILQNPVYTGTFYANRMDCAGMGLNRHLAPDQRRAMQMRAREEWIPIPVPAILDEPTWRRAQEIIAQARRLMHTQVRSPYLLSGLVSCGICGLPMVGTRRNHWGRRVRGYTCRRAWAGAKSAGCGRFVRADPLEEAIWARVIGWVADPDVLVATVTGDSAGMRERVMAEVSQVDQALHSAEQGKRNILAVLERNLAEPGECQEALARIQARIEGLRARRRDLQASVVDPQTGDVDRIRDWAREWLASGAVDGLPFDRRRLLVRQFVVEVAVHEAALVVRARIPLAPRGSGDEDRDPHAPACEAQGGPRSLSRRTHQPGWRGQRSDARGCRLGTPDDARARRPGCRVHRGPFPPRVAFSREARGTSQAVRPGRAVGPFARSSRQRRGRWSRG